MQAEGGRTGRRSRNARARTLGLLVGCGLALAGPRPGLVAQEAPVTVLEPVVVTASRIPAPVDEVAGSTTVISREEIEARQPASAVDLLRQVPGVHVDQIGGPGGISSIYLRGGDPNYTVVLIDGIEVNDPTNPRGGSFDLSTLDPRDIERIEVVRGPLSALYGSDALAGVVNIITREGTPERRWVLDGSVGTEGYQQIGAGALGPLPWGRYALRTDYVDRGEPVEGSTFVGRSVAGKVDLAPTRATSLRLVGRYLDADATSFPEDSGGPEFAAIRAVDRRDIDELSTGGELTQRIRPWWQLGARAAFYQRRERLASPGVAPGLRDPFGIPPNRSRNNFHRTVLSLSSLFEPVGGLAVTAGGDAAFETGRSDGELLFGAFPLPTRFDLDRRSYGAFAEARYRTPWGPVLQAALRADFPEEFDAEVSPRIGALYRFDRTGTTLEASWSRGFKLPSFFALGNPIVGNPALRPETSDSVDVGVRQEFLGGRGSVGVTYFHAAYRNAIDFEEGPPPRLVNRSRVRADGVELALTLAPIKRVSTTGFVTFTRTDIVGTEEALRNRPRWRAGFDVRWTPRDDLALALTGLYVGETLDSSIPTGDVTLDPYVRLDATATWTLQPGWDLYAAVDNLLDAGYQEAVGFPAPGIAVRVGTRLAF